MASSQEQTKLPVQITKRKNRFNTEEVLKTFEIQQYVGFFVITGLLKLFMAYLRHTNTKSTMQGYYSGWNKF